MVRALAVLLLVAWADDLSGLGSAQSQGMQALTHVCPMHPDVRTSGAGACPRCGMALVPIDPLEMRDYRLEMTTAPHPAAPGRPLRLRLTVRDPDTNAVVRDFAVVHEKTYHLFVISQDLEHYAHLHPVQEQDGSFVLDLTLPHAGYYKIYSDFLPVGGTPQVIPRPLATGGFTGDLTTSAARLTPDGLLEPGSSRPVDSGFGRTVQKVVAGLSIDLMLPGDGLIAGRDEKFVYRVTDATTGAAVSDLEPYLGAWGHSLIMSEDTLDFVHAHPLELLPGGGVSTNGGGPTLTFKALLPRPGHYRVWTQLKRRGEISTVVFTVAVASPR